MVVTLWSATAETGVTQEGVACPPICTVQAPHCAMPQPNLVPVRPTTSRIAHSNGMSGSTSREIGLPLSVNETAMSLSWENAKVGQRPPRGPEDDQNRAIRVTSI